MTYYSGTVERKFDSRQSHRVCPLPMLGLRKNVSLVIGLDHNRKARYGFVAFTARPPAGLLRQWFMHDGLYDSIYRLAACEGRTS